ncbi:diacylglycerol kinase family protein [Methanobrevibacter sp.]|uniref:diacylglycerol kinase family protein n=1 Tax=Methanobrevibacter sp. TaxID=66852 RepID=UPI003866904F
MKFIDSFKYAIEGLLNTTNVERNLKIHFTVTLCVIILGLMVKLSKMEWVICIILFGLVISAELFNTAFEKTLDYINEDYDADIKFIKDASAAAVLVMAISSAIIGLMIFLPKLL